MARPNTTKPEAAGEPEGFRLSRIQAKGWNAAHSFLSGVSGNPDQAKIDALNPYKSRAERARWNAGFVNAIEATTVK